MKTKYNQSYLPAYLDWYLLLLLSIA